MDKHRIIASISVVLDRGTATEAQINYFSGKKHDDLVAEFRSFLEGHQRLLGAAQATIIQGPNDRGTDLIISYGDYKLGFQIKNEGDVAADYFAQKVKSQLSDSLAHGLDKWYLLICAPLKSGNTDLGAKIRHLLSELSAYQNPYIAPYGLYQPLTKQDRSAILTPDNHRTAERLVKTPPTRLPKNVDRFLADDSLTSEQRSQSYSEMMEYFRRLEILPQFTRTVLCEIVRRIKGQRDGLIYAELESAFDPEAAHEQAAILEERSWITRWPDQEMRVWRLELTDDAPSGWPVLQSLRSFCEEHSVPLEQLIVHLDFSSLEAAPTSEGASRSEGSSATH